MPHAAASYAQTETLAGEIRVRGIEIGGDFVRLSHVDGLERRMTFE
jgi:hypothetical protein